MPIPMSDLLQPPRLAWQLHPFEYARDRLISAHYPGALPVHELDAAVLYAYGTSPRAEIITWLQPLDEKAKKRFRSEAIETNRFDRWLERCWPVDFWRLATAWTYYSNSLSHGDHPIWTASLNKIFPPDPLLDQLLAHSGGRILWRFQLEILIDAAIENSDRARGLAKVWILQRQRASEFTGLILPNGMMLKQALAERAYRRLDNSILVLARPHTAVIARVHAIFNDALGHARSQV